MLSPSSPEYVEVIIEAARRDPSIARVLREICALDAPVRSSALDLVAAYLGTWGAPGASQDPRRPGALGGPAARDVLDCVAALRRDEVARRVAEALGPPE